MQLNYLVDIQPSKRFTTDEGFIICKDSVLAGVGIQKYYAKELGIQDRNPMDVIPVARLADDVLNEASLATFEGKPVTLLHPKDKVTAENYRELNKGSMANLKILQDEQIIVGDVTIADGEAIKAIQDGNSCLSVGYDCEIVPQQGIFNGQVYEYVQKNIRANHLAIVPKGRFPQARLSDEDLTKEKNVEHTKVEHVEPVVHQLTDEELTQRVQSEARRIADEIIEANEKRNELINKAKILVADYAPSAEVDARTIKLEAIKAIANNEKAKQVLDAMFNGQSVDNLSDYALEVGFDFMVNLSKNLPAMLNDSEPEPLPLLATQPIIGTALVDSAIEYIDPYQEFKKSFVRNK